MSKYKTRNEIIKINLIKKNPWNPNQMDKKTLKAEKESIQKYGVVAPIILRPLKDKYQIIDGEHRFVVCTGLGYKQIPSVIIDGLEDKDAKKLTIILNETKGQNNKIELGKLLGALEVDFGEDLKIGLPFNDDDLVYTSGDGGYFNPGIPVGMLKKENNTQDIAGATTYTCLKFH